MTAARKLSEKAARPVPKPPNELTSLSDKGRLDRNRATGKDYVDGFVRLASVELIRIKLLLFMYYKLNIQRLVIPIL